MDSYHLWVFEPINPKAERIIPFSLQKMLTCSLTKNQYTSIDVELTL